MEYDIDIIEPGYYWRIRTTTTYGDMIPEPVVVCVRKTGSSLVNIETILYSSAYHSQTRIILDVSDNCLDGNRHKSIVSWSDDSVGRFNVYSEEVKAYEFLPAIADHNGRRIQDIKLGRNIIDSTRLCAKIFERARGNRSCFDKCD